MNFDIFKLLPLLFQAIELVGPIREAIRQGQSALDVLKTKGPDVIGIVQGIGAALFPDLSADNQTQAGALKVFDQPTVRWIQETLNNLGASPVLVVDGSYGPLTKAEVTEFQQAHPPLDVDGWAGRQTQAALQDALSKIAAPQH